MSLGRQRSYFLLVSFAPCPLGLDYLRSNAVHLRESVRRGGFGRGGGLLLLILGGWGF